MRHVTCPHPGPAAAVDQECQGDGEDRTEHQHRHLLVGDAGHDQDAEAAAPAEGCQGRRAHGEDQGRTDAGQDQRDGQGEFHPPEHFPR
jgi:hypothetical protein